MRKHQLSLIALSCMGAALSFLLLMGHYIPDLHGRVIACGEGIADPCFAVNHSDFAVFLGIPVAAYGLSFYLFIIFTLLVADYASGPYPLYAALILVPLNAAGLAADAVLAAIMCRLGEFCTLCAFTYGVNIGLFAVSLLWLRLLMRTEGLSFRSLPAFCREESADSPHRKAALALYIIFGFLLFLSVLSSSAVLKERTSQGSLPAEQLDEQVRALLSTAPERIEIPESGLRFGNTNAPVRIVVFTDFLCGACFEFYRAERKLLARYRERVSVAHFNYPLDSSCNPLVRSSRYPGSCTASRAMIAAGSIGIFPPYLRRHFDGSSRAQPYTERLAVALSSGLADPRAFSRALRSGAAAALLARDLELARRYRVSATPTLFINGRRIEGVPPEEVLIHLVERLLPE
jgi:protein-disulfide isomerase/uncharacterized membrane protein